MSFITPGVGDYDIDKDLVREKSPVCTIGNQERFKKVPSQQKYLTNLPVYYQSNLEEKMKPKIPMGAINKTLRFKNHES